MFLEKYSSKLQTADPMESPENLNAFNVVTWNILLDKTRTSQGKVRPQSQRTSNHIDTLRGINVELDVVAIQEAERTREQHNGEVLARHLGYAAGTWAEHNTSKRKGEHIGMFGGLADEVEFFELGHDKLGVLTYVGRVAVVGVHLRNETVGPMRTYQTKAVLKKIENSSEAVIMGDFNATPREEPHRLMQDADFESAFMVNGTRPKTWPTEDYRHVFYPKPLRSALPQFRYDDIMVRGLNVEWARTFVGDSDHKGLAARVARP